MNIQHKESASAFYSENRKIVAISMLEKKAFSSRIDSQFGRSFHSFHSSRKLENVIGHGCVYS